MRQGQAPADSDKGGHSTNKNELNAPHAEFPFAFKFPKNC
jgi:hypothetical protein